MNIKMVLAMGLLSMLGLGSCANAQKKSVKEIKVEEKETNQNMEDCKKRKIETLDSLLNEYQTKPVYYIVYSNRGCLVDIQVNGFSTEKIMNEEATGEAAVTINTNILRSGKQKVSVKLTPLPEDKVITESKPFTMKIGYQDSMEELDENADTWHWVLEMPRIEVPENGLEVYEYNGEFEANVPYNAIGYSDCIDLRTIPNIEEMVVKKFQEMRLLIQNRQYKTIQDIQYEKYYDIALTLYQSSSDVLQSWQDDIELYEKADKKDYLEINDYNLVFYADGRLVTLEKQTDKYGWWASALLWIKDDGEYWKGVDFPQRWGIRKGSKDLVLIR